MSADVCCAAGPPVTHDYTPKGSWSQDADLEVYLAAPAPDSSSAPAKGLVLLPDIFGLSPHKQIFQVADRLAEAGFQVAAPDVFHGRPWSLEHMPPKPDDGFMEWLTTTCSFANVLPDVQRAATLLAARGCAQLGIVGFCWGASVALQAGADAILFQAVGGVHPSLFSQEKAIAEHLQVPVILLSAKGDPLEAVQEGVAAKPWASRCVFKRYEDQAHGFCAARGDWSQPEVAAAATEAIALVAGFMQANLS